MKTYCKSPKVVKISTILSKKSLTPCDFGVLLYKNNNFKTIGEIVNKEDIGEQIDVKQYLAFRSGWFLGTISGMDAEIYNIEKGGENISPIIYNKSTKKLKQGEIIVSRNATLGKVSYVLNDVNGILNGGLSKLYIENVNTRFYVFGVLLQNFFENQLILMTSGGGTQQNAKRQNVLDCIIPFPTEKNNQNPKDIETLVSIITQNIIDKEQQIRLKNDKINNLIETELKDHQKTLNYQYKYPKISEIKRVGRLDTGMYEKKYKHAEWIIHNSNYEKFSINENELKGGNTPKTRIFEPTQKEYIWFTPTDIKGGVLNDKHYIKALSYNLGEKLALLFSNRSNCGECILYNPHTYKKGGHHNQGIYRKEFDEKDFIQNIFILCLFNSNFYQDMISHIATGATFGELRIEQYANIDLPQFTGQMQLEISNEYYSNQPKNENLNFDNYLELEKERNKKLGIFQLNMELFSLKEKLEDIIDKIIMEEPIEINFSY